MIYYCEIDDYNKYVDLLNKAVDMPVYRMKKFMSYIKLSDKINCVVAYLLLKKLVGFEVDYITNSNEKPEFINSDIKFNISHTNGFVVVGIDNNDIGIDIENVSDFTDNMINYMLSVNDINKYNDFINDLEFLTKVWTIKESFIKYNGKGLTYPANEIELDYLSNLIEFNNLYITTKKINTAYMSICGVKNNYKVVKIDITDLCN